MAYANVKTWRQATKQRIIESLGERCNICGYNKHHEAFDVHHIDPNEKEFTIGSVRACAKSWDRIVIELRKCILLCSNCHRLLHAGVLSLPETLIRFNEDYANYFCKLKKDEIDECPICGKLKNKYLKTCSYQCAGKVRRRVDRPEKSIIIEQTKKFGFVKTGKLYGVSDNAIRRWLK